MFQPTAIDIEKYVADDYSEKCKTGECSVYFDRRHIVDYVVQSEDDPTTYFISFGGIYGHYAAGHVRLQVLWKEQMVERVG